MRHWLTTWTLIAMGCGSSGGGAGDGGSDARLLNLVDNPQPHEGGGLGSGGIAGELNVFVVDGQSGTLISGAEVRLGDGHVAEPLMGTTGDDGLVIFREGATGDEGAVPAEPGSLSGPQVVTASMADYPPTTWFGVNGAVVTIPLDPVPEDPGPVPTATVTGTIAGWDAIPDPDRGFALVAAILYTWTSDLGAPENDIEQDPGPFPGIDLLTANSCYRISEPYFPFPAVDSCDFKLNTRTGAQALYAILAEVNLDSGLVDIFDFAVSTGHDLAANEELQDVALDLIDPLDVLDVQVELEALPSGVNALGWLAALDLGAEGLLVSESLDGGDAVKLPEAKGNLAGGYFVTAQATGGREGIPRTSIFEYDPNVTGPVELPDWLSIPDDIEVDQGVEPNSYSFDRVNQASVHSGSIVSLEDTDRTPAWNMLLLDPPAPEPVEGQDGGAPDSPESTITFALPQLSPDPLPQGDLELTVFARDILGFDPLDFSIGGIDDKDIRRVSIDRVTFRRE